jgi:hypothetical protein
MSILAFIFLVWTAVCWFSAPFSRPPFGLAIFEADPVLPLILSVLSGAIALVLWHKKRGREFLKRTSDWLDNNKKVAWLLIGILFLTLVLHLPAVVMFRGSNNSDSAIEGVAGYHIAEGKTRPMFRYHRHVIGSLNMHITAVLQLALGKSPIYLQVVNISIYLGFVLILFAIVKRTAGAGTALLSAALAAFTPRQLFFHIALVDFIGALFWSALSLYLLVLLLEKERPGPKQYFWYGAVIGIGLWIHPLTVYAAAAGVIALFVRDKLFFIKPAFFALPPGLFLGGALVLLDSYYYDWAVFRYLFSQGADPFGVISRFLTGASVFFVHLPQYLGLSADSSEILGNPILVTIILAIFGLCFLLYLYHCREKLSLILKGRNENPGTALFLIFAVSCFLAFSLSEQAQPPSAARYLIPIWIAVPAVISVAATAAARWKRAAGPAIAGVFFCLLFFSHASQIGAIAARERIWAEWDLFCARRGITRFYGNFWRTYQTAFITSERVIGSAREFQEDEHYPPYKAMVDDAPNPPAFLFTRSERNLQAYLEAKLIALNIDYRVAESPFGTVLLDLSQHATLSRLVDIEHKPYRAVFSGQWIRRIGKKDRFPHLRLLELGIVNTGKAAWRADGRTGLLELVICKVSGEELRRQPLSRDVPPGGELRWRVLLDTENKGADRVLARLEVNGFLLNEEKRPLEIDLSSTKEKEPIEIHEIDATLAHSLASNAVAEDYIFFDGWGILKEVGRFHVRWSSAGESTIGFFNAGRSAIEMTMLAYPYQPEPDSPHRIAVKFSLNGKELPQTVELTERRTIKLVMPAENLSLGINRLKFRFHRADEKDLPSWDRQPEPFRPRCFGLRLLRFSPAKTVGRKAGSPRAIPEAQ